MLPLEGIHPQMCYGYVSNAMNHFNVRNLKDITLSLGLLFMCVGFSRTH